MLKPKEPLRSLKKLPRAPGEDRARARRQSSRYRNLVRRRSAHRTEEQDHPPLGKTRFVSFGAERSAHGLGQYLRRDLPKDGRRRWPRPPALRHASHEPALGRDRQTRRARRSRSPAPRSGKLASRRRAENPCQHHYRPAASQMPRTQSARECLAVHARKLAVEPRLHILRKHPRSLLLRLENPPRATLAHLLPRHAPVSAWVLINADWYKSVRTRRASAGVGLPSFSGITRRALSQIMQTVRKLVEIMIVGFRFRRRHGKIPHDSYLRIRALAAPAFA